MQLDKRAAYGEKIFLTLQQLQILLVLLISAHVLSFLSSPLARKC